jgi:putative endopeptidase
VLPQVLNSMDLTADPCSDFYQYACGTFLDVTEVEEDQNEWALSWSGVNARNSELLREVVETDRGIAGDFYRSCLNMTRINELGTEPLKPFLAAVETLRGCTEALKLPFASVHKRTCGVDTLLPLVVKWQMIDIKVFFDWSIEVNPHDPTQYAVSLMQDGITLPDPKWYYSGTHEANLKLKGLEEVATKVFRLCGEDEATALENAHNAVAFERELAKLFRSAAHERVQQQTVFTLAQADQLAPNFGISRVLKVTYSAHTLRAHLHATSVWRDSSLRGLTGHTGCAGARRGVRQSA